MNFKRSTWTAVSGIGTLLVHDMFFGTILVIVFLALILLPLIEAWERY